MTDQNTQPSQAPQPTIDVDKRVEQFVRVRDLKAEMKARHDEEMKPLNDAIDMLKLELSTALNMANAENIKTSSGTVSVLTKVTASAADINAFWTWVVTQGAFDMLDKKPNVTAITEYVKQNGVPPPGVNYNVFRDIGVRRK